MAKNKPECCTAAAYDICQIETFQAWLYRSVQVAANGCEAEAGVPIKKGPRRWGPNKGIKTWDNRFACWYPSWRAAPAWRL